MRTGNADPVTPKRNEERKRADGTPEQNRTNPHRGASAPQPVAKEKPTRQRGQTESQSGKHKKIPGEERELPTIHLPPSDEKIADVADDGIRIRAPRGYQISSLTP